MQELKIGTGFFARDLASSIGDHKALMSAVLSHSTNALNVDARMLAETFVVKYFDAASSFIGTSGTLSHPLKDHFAKAVSVLSDLTRAIEINEVDDIKRLVEILDDLNTHFNEKGEMSEEMIFDLPGIFEGYLSRNNLLSESDRSYSMRPNSFTVTQLFTPKHQEGFGIMRGRTTGEGTTYVTLKIKKATLSHSELEENYE